MNKFIDSGGAAFSSKDMCWRTPSKFWNELNNEFNFVLDACALKDSTLVLDNWYGPDHDDLQRRDALIIDWAKDAGGGNVFMNPPYGKEIGSFMAKAVEQSKQGCTVVCLVPARTDTRWFHNYVFNENASIRFLKGRLKFSDGPNSAPFPSAVVILKSHGN